MKYAQNTATIQRVTAAAIVSGVLMISFTPRQAAAQADDVKRICSGELMLFTEPGFEVFDKNNDAALDDQEVANCESLNTVFAELDLDADERLSQQEYTAFPAIWKQRVLAFGEGK